MIENGDGHVKSSTKRPKEAIKISSTNFESIVNLSESDSDEIFFDAEEPNSPKFRFEFFFLKKCLKKIDKKGSKLFTKNV